MKPAPTTEWQSICEELERRIEGCYTKEHYYLSIGKNQKAYLYKIKREELENFLDWVTVNHLHSSIGVTPEENKIRKTHSI